MHFTKSAAVLVAFAVIITAGVAKPTEDKLKKKNTRADYVTRVEGYLASHQETFRSVSEKGADLRFGVGGKDFSVYAWDDTVMGFPAPTIDTLPATAEALERIAIGKKKKIEEEQIKKSNYPEALRLAENKAISFFVSEGITSATNGSPVSVESIKSLYEAWEALEAPLGDEKCATYLRLVSWIELLGGSREAIIYRPSKGK